MSIRLAVHPADDVEDSQRADLVGEACIGSDYLESRVQSPAVGTEKLPNGFAVKHFGVQNAADDDVIDRYEARALAGHQFRGLGAADVVDAPQLLL